MFDALLAGEWLAAVPDVHERLLADPPARVPDIACGEGRSTIAIARGYPNVHVDGIDIDTASIEAAQRHLADSELDECSNPPGAQGSLMCMSHHVAATCSRRRPVCARLRAADGAISAILAAAGPARVVIPLGMRLALANRRCCECDRPAGPWDVGL